MRFVPTALAIFLALLLAGQGSSVVGQQLGRASITGIVSDSTGAVIPGVTVTAVSVETNVPYKTITNEVGNYMLASLPIGQYVVSYSAAGFKEFSRSGLALTSGQIARVDVALEVGQITEKLSVTAEAPLLQTESAEASKAVGTSVFNNLPLSFGGGRNMAVFADKLVPGVIGSAWDMRIQGTPSQTQNIVIDGMSQTDGFLPGGFSENSISPEAIQELTVFTGNVSAEYGRAGGGSLNFILKSGANQLHGSGLFYLRNEILNSNDWNNNRLLAADPNFSSPQTRNFLRPKNRQFTKGFSAGGPVFIPKVYNGRDKTFFYFTLERFNTEQVGPTSLSTSIPQPEMFDGNLSRLLTGRQVGTDILGRRVTEGQVYDPTTLREVNGQLVADPFLGNIIPTSRISQVARNIKAIAAKYYPPVTSDLSNNLYWTRYAKQNVQQLTLKGDHSFSPSHKVSGYYGRNKFPRNLEDQGGIWSLADPTGGGPLARAQFHKRYGHYWNASYDWTIGPTLLNHASFGMNLTGLVYASRQIGKQWSELFGIKGVGLDFPPEQWTTPAISFGSSPVVTYASWVMPDNRDRHYWAYVLTDSITWQHRSHTIKFGVEWDRLQNQENKFDNSGGTFSFSSTTTAIPGQSYSSSIGHSFASFLLGSVNSASVSPRFDSAMRRSYGAVFAQDNWKVTPRFTLNLGLRWSGNTPAYDVEDRIANFNPKLPDPNAYNMLGAVEYMGTGTGRTGKRSPAPGDWKDFGPSFGFAYRLTDRVVMRGGYGITYTPETVGWWNYFVAGFKPINSVEANSKGMYRPVFNIDDGYPGKTEAPNLDPSWGQKRGSTIIPPNYTQAGYIQNFNFGFQSEVAKDLRVELEWRASKGTRLHSAGNVTPNQIRSEYLSKGAVLGQVIDSPQKAAAAGLPYPYAGWSGQGANTLMPFPQITTMGLSSFGDPVGFTTYHSANLIVTKRMSKGFHLYGAYVFSKNIANVTDVSGSGNTTGLQDTYNRQAYKAVAPDDRTHVLKSSLVWDLPFGKKRALLGDANRLLNAVVGGWTVSAILNYASGTPLGVPSSRTRPVGWNGPGVYANFTTPAGGFKQVFDTSKFNPWNANDPGNRFFDPSAFSDALSQQLGNSPPRFPQVRGLWRWNEDASILKYFPVRERLTIQFRLELLNAFNRHTFGGPDTNMNNSYFGNVRTASGSRTGQFGLRVDW